MSSTTINRDIFDELFVLEIANNHWGDLERGRRIVRELAKVVRYNNVRAAIKLQFRDVETFVHRDHRHRTDIRYVQKTLDTKMSRSDLIALTEEIRASGCLPMATPFDENSVDLCVEIGIPIIKLASSDLNDWFLIEKIAATRKPVIASTGGSSLKDLDDLVIFFAHRAIPLAINHCVSLYPSEDVELELNQIDFLRDRYPGLTIGFSTHEYHDWSSSMLIAYAKGARTFERHVDLPYAVGDEREVSPYCSLPEQIDEWFRAFHRGRDMCGSAGSTKRVVSERETSYLDGLVRGVWARRDLKAGEIVRPEDLYLAIPLLKGQLSCREVVHGDVLRRDVAEHAPLLVTDTDGPYARDPSAAAAILQRGFDSV